jgi:two-component system sensor histidine kinase HydH
MLHKFSRYFSNASSWLVIGMSCILAIVVVGLAMMNYNRESQYMAKVLSDKGATLIRAFEAGARTGMMGELGALPRLDTLIKETAVQPSILYIVIVDQSGEILAHSDSSQIGQRFLDANDITALEADDDVKWRTVGRESASAFEVYKLFLPILPTSPQAHMMQQGRKMTQNHMGVWCSPNWMGGLQEEKLLNPKVRPIIVIGMDTTSFEEAINEDIKLTIVISGVLLLLGVAGVVSLFWAQSYTKSKTMINNIRAISSEMISNLPEGIILTDNDLKVRYLNEIAQELLNVNGKSVIGDSSKDILPMAISQMRASSSQDKKMIEHEIEIKQLNGAVIPVSVIATEVVTDDNIFVGHMYLIKDLTQIKQLQAEIQKKDKMAAIGNLAAGVAHEVRNPLSSIKGYASYFKTLFEDDSENYAAAEVLVNEADRLNRVITELLEIARPSDIKPQHVDAKSIFESAMRLVQADPNQKAKTKISLNITDGIQSIFIDPDRFVQILLNLYLNSFQAMPDGGLLTTKVFSRNNHVVIVISDTGSGMSLETKKKIFNPYFTTKTTGTGLGMAIVQKIIEAHNGVISVSSEENQGTVVTIELPH